MASYKILDGAMGSELIRRGIQLPEHIWSAHANINFSNEELDNVQSMFHFLYE